MSTRASKLQGARSSAPYDVLELNQTEKTMAKRSIAAEYQLRRNFTAFSPKPSRVVCRRRRTRQEKCAFAFAVFTACFCAFAPMIAAYLAR